jgi:hypothetical protein
MSFSLMSLFFLFFFLKYLSLSFNLLSSLFVSFFLYFCRSFFYFFTNIFPSFFQFTVFFLSFWLLTVFFYLFLFFCVPSMFGVVAKIITKTSELRCAKRTKKMPRHASCVTLSVYKLVLTTFIEHFGAKFLCFA